MKPRHLLLALLALLAAAPRAQAATAPGAVVLPWCPVAAPGLTITAPAPGELLQRQQINYVAGGLVDVELSMSTCNYLYQVQANGIVLGTSGSSGGIEPGPSTWYEVLSTHYPAAGVKHVQLRIHFANLELGHSTPFRVVVRNSAYGTAASDFTVVGVSRVNQTASGDVVKVSRSAAELHNSMAVALFNLFGAGTNSYTTSTGKHLYNASYDNLSLTVGASGVAFAWSAKVEVENWCDPTMRVAGTFAVVPASGGLAVVWPSGPSVNLQWPWYCVLADFFDGDDEAAARADVKQSIEEELGAMVPPEAALFLDHAATTPGELALYFRMPYASVSYQLPYERPDSYQGASAPGLALNAGETIAVSVAGAAAICATDASSSHAATCSKLTTGAHGLYNANTNTPNQGLLVGEYLKIFNGVFKFYRNPALLPFGSDNVGMLVPRVWRVDGAGTAYKGDRDSCTIATGSWKSKLVLGFNDHLDGLSGQTYGAGTMEATVGFPSAAVGSMLTACAGGATLQEVSM